MDFIRMVIGGAISIIGIAICTFAIAREWLADPLGLDWLDASKMDQQLLGGDLNNYLLFMAGGVVVAVGTKVAGRGDEWFR